MQDFDKIYAEYFSEVYKFVLTLCQNPVLAEEITQEVFFKALKNIESFKGECKLSTWLCRIAKNTFYDYAKKSTVRSIIRLKSSYLTKILKKSLLIKKQFIPFIKSYTNSMSRIRKYSGCELSENYLSLKSVHCLIKPKAGPELLITEQKL